MTNETEQNGSAPNKKTKPGKICRLRFLFHDIVRFLSWIHLWIMVRPKYLFEKGATRKTNGKTLVTSTHGSWSDSITVILTFASRRAHFVMAEEFFHKGFKKWFYSRVGCTPIKRGSIFDNDGFDKAIDVLNDERLLTIFPEGGIGNVDSVRRFKAGAGILALKTGATIVPLYVDSRISIKRRGYIVVGKAISVSELCDGQETSENARIIADKLKQKTEELKQIYDDYMAKKKKRRTKSE